MTLTRKLGGATLNSSRRGGKLFTGGAANAAKAAKSTKEEAAAAAMRKTADTEAKKKAAGEAAKKKAADAEAKKKKAEEAAAAKGPTKPTAADPKAAAAKDPTGLTAKVKAGLTGLTKAGLTGLTKVKAELDPLKIAAEGASGGAPPRVTNTSLYPLPNITSLSEAAIGGVSRILSGTSNGTMSEEELKAIEHVSSNCVSIMKQISNNPENIEMLIKQLAKQLIILATLINK